MHISVICPSCGATFNLNPEMRGKRMRCPNSVCREAFIVQEAPAQPENGTSPPPPDEPASAAPKKNQTTGAVGEMVPFLTSELATEALPPVVEPPAEPPPVRRPAPEVVPLLPAEAVAPPAPEAPWQEPPPVRRPTGKPPAAPVVAPRPKSPKTPVPTPKPLWEATPPPVRRKSSVSDTLGPPVEATPPSPAPTPEPEPQAAAEAPTAASAPTEPPSERWDVPPPVRSIQGRRPATPAALPALRVPPPPPRRKESPGKRKPGESGKLQLPPRPQLASAATRRTRSAWLMIGIVLLFSVVVVPVIVYVLVNGGRDEASVRARAEEAYTKKKFTEAAALYGGLAEQFPDSEHRANDQFLHDLSLARGPVEDENSDLEAARAGWRKFLEEHSDDAEFPKYKDSDIWQTWVGLLERQLKEAESLLPVPASPEGRLAELRQARDRADAGLTESRKFNPDDTGPASIQERLAKVDQALAYLKKRQKLLERLRSLEPAPERIAEALVRVQGSEFAEEPLVRTEFDRLWVAANNAVRYYAADREPAVPDVSPDPALAAADDALPGLLFAPLLDRSGPVPVDGTVFALARGVLYALRATDGQVRWARRVGIDTTALPVRLPRTDTTPELALVLSAETNTLTARRIEDGKAVWQHALGKSPCLGQPVVVGRRAYLGTLDGRVEEIELLHGRKLGEFRGCLPLPVGGARQEGSDLLYFPADHKLVYVLDVKQQKVAAVVETGHPSGSLRSAPVVVGGGPAGAATPSTLILTQTDGLHRMKLRALPLPVGPSPAVEMSLDGWPWFAPYADGERLAVATDAGVLGLFGIRQPRTGDPPLYPVVDQEVKILSAGEGAGRALLVHATESDFWVLALGVLQQFRLGIDPVAGLKLAPVRSKPLPLGSPLHAGQVGASADTLFVVTQSRGRGGCAATAVDAATGQVCWKRQLGLVCAADPVVLGDQILALDQNGSLVLCDAGRPADAPGLDPSAAGQRWIVRPPEDGPTTLLPSPDGAVVYALTAGREKLTVRPLRPGKEFKPQLLGFRVTLGGTPAAGAGYLLVPAADGALLRQPLVGDAPAETGPTWRAPAADLGAVGHVVRLDGDDFLVTDGSTGLRRVSWPAGKVSQEKKLDFPAFEHRIAAAPAVLPPTGGEPRVLVADSSGTLTLLQGERLARVRSWPAGGAVTAGPFVRGGQAACVVDRRHLVWIDPDRPEPAWTYTTPGAAIVGQPQRSGDLLFVTDLAGQFVALDVATGKPAGPALQLRSRLAPAAAATPIGGRLFAPLADGTVLLLPLDRKPAPGE